SCCTSGFGPPSAPEPHRVSPHAALPLSTGRGRPAWPPPAPASPTGRPRDRSRTCRRRRRPATCARAATRAVRARPRPAACPPPRSEEHTSELQSRENLVCRLLLEKKKNL